MKHAITLYQFPISHYCEKVRWALDYKDLNYTPQNFLPGMHVKAIKKIAASSAVPVLTVKEQAVQGSANIITFLDNEFSDKSLTPVDIELQQQAEYWEKLADQDIGPHVRRLAYSVLLDYPQAVIPRLCADGPWYGSLMLKLIFPRLKTKMQSLLKINPRNIEQSREILDQAIEKTNVALSGRRFLVGDRFSRADLAVAALLGPFCKPDEFDEIDTPMPQAFENLRQEYQSKAPFVSELYRQYR